MSTVFITGATKNTGLAIAKKFAKEGYNVAISSRNFENAQIVAKFISEEYNVKAKGYSLDLTKYDDIVRVFDEIKADFGTLDTFVANSANLGMNIDILSATEKSYDDLMNVNVRGTYFCCQRAAMIMKEQKKGAIVIISSVHSKASVYGRSLYSLSKAAINNLATSMTVEVGLYGIRTNCLLAGAIKTDRWDGLSKEEVERRRKNWPLGVESTGEDIANGVFYLGTDLSGTVSGAQLAVDSGILTTFSATSLKVNGGKQ